jgi:hypothetical protein
MISQVAIIAIAMLVWPGIVRAQQQQPGGSVAIVTSASATVKMVDPAKRVILLETPEGYMRAIRCGKAVTKFDQIKVGDQVRALALERVAVFVGKGVPGTEDASFVARAPRGGRPGMIIADSDDVTARIASVDAANRTITLEGAAGLTKPIKVSADVDLAGVKAGDELTVRVTKGLALWVQGPQNAAGPAAAVLAAQGDAMVAGSEGLDSATATATVEAIDREKRMVTLKGESGQTRQIYLGKSVVNFDQIQVGDKVRATLAEEVAVAVTKGGPSPSVSEGIFTARAPVGSKPGILIANTAQITGKIQSIDAAKRTITLVEADNEPRPIQVGPKVDLAELKAGDDVTARVTQALAILVEKP